MERDQQERLSLQQLHKLLDKKRDFEEDPQFTERIHQWYAIHQCCHHKYTPIQEVLIKYIEKMACLDVERAAQVKRTLDGVYPLELISGYAEEIFSFHGETKTREWIRRFAYFEQCNLTWWKNAAWAQRALVLAFSCVNQEDAFSRYSAAYLNQLLTLSPSFQMFPRMEIRTVARMYATLQEKDVFERHYHLFLTHCLLHSDSYCLKWEQDAIDVFRPYASSRWLNRLEGMVQEIKTPLFVPLPMISKNINARLCSHGYWPSLMHVPFQSPPELCSQMRAITRSFCKKFPDRKLLWRMNLGRAEVTVSITPQSQYDFDVTTYQMMILLLFNDQRKVTFQDILTRTGIPRTEISHYLLSFVHPKVAVILKRPNTKVLDLNHEFILNPRYQNKQRRVVIPLMKPLTAEEESQDEDQKAKKIQQQHQIDASICCIMMSRKIMRHPLLVAEVISRLKARFLPKPYIIKKCIEAMIEQEYLVRDVHDRSTYRYC